MSSICDTCRHDDCGLRMDGLKYCDMHERPDSRYTKFFGTPERAVQAIVGSFLCPQIHCDECGSREICDLVTSCRTIEEAKSELLEWLKGCA